MWYISIPLFGSGVCSENNTLRCKGHVSTLGLHGERVSIEQPQDEVETKPAVELIDDDSWLTGIAIPPGTSTGGTLGR